MKILQTSKAKRYRERHRHACADCAKLVQRTSTRCRQCEAKVNPKQLEHGYARKGAVHPVHSIWREMIQRCTNPKSKRYATYGDRGIKVCACWIKSFEKFLSDVGPRPTGVGKGGRALYSIDRVDNDGDYKPENVKWSTGSEQQRRTTRNRSLTLKGETMLLCDWARRLGVNHTAITFRLDRMGLSEEETLTRPFRRRARAA